MITEIRRVASIENQLTEGPAQQRLEAVEGLSPRDAAAVAELLLAMLGDSDRNVRKAAITRLENAMQGALCRQVVGILAGDWSAIDAVRDIQGSERRLLLSSLKRLLASTADNRRWVIHALGRLGDRRAIPWLRPYLKSNDPLRQRAACIALAELGDVRSASLLLELVCSNDVHVASNAAVALERLGEERLVAAYRGVPEGNADAITDTIEMVSEGDLRIIDLLLAGLRRERHRCRTISTALTLCILGVAEAVPHVAALLDEVAVEVLDRGLDEEAEGIILTIAGVLGASRLPEAAAAAVNLLANPLYWRWEPEIAGRLLDRLDHHALPAVVELLRRGAQWPEPDAEADGAARVTACHLLEKLGDRRSVSSLMDILHAVGTPEALRDAAAGAVAAICDRDASALTLLPRIELAPRSDNSTEGTEMAAESQSRKRTINTAHKHNVVPEPEYVFPILQALVTAGGRSEPQAVRAAVYPHVANRLSQWDRGPESDKQGSRTRWEHRVDCVRFKLCLAGLMVRSSAAGEWEITDEGRSQLTAGDLEATWRQISSAFTRHRQRR